MRIVFIVILLMHGLIHLMGFIKAFKLGEISQLTQHISKPAGLVWLLTTFLFISAAVTFLFRKEAWWMIALLAVVLSQTLISLYWQEAKYGTIANVIIIVGIIVGYGIWEYKTSAKKELKVFMPSAITDAEIVTPEMLDKLPVIVQTWLRNTNTIHRGNIQTSYMKQVGKMRTSPAGKWYPFTAKQWSKIEPPGFFWLANMKSMLGMHVAIKDTYQQGRGSMRVKLLSLFTVDEANGKEMNQGALLRLLGEIIWTPSYALSDYIQWEPVDELSAKATLQYGGLTASALFMFNREGYVKRVEAQRYFYRKEGATLERWVVDIDENSYKAFENIIIPQKASITWKLKEGDYHWYSVEIKEVKYNTLDLCCKFPEGNSTEDDPVILL